MWNLSTGQLISTLQGHEDTVWSVAISPDGQTLATGSSVDTIKLWSLDWDELLALGCDYLQEYLATRDEEREELCPGQ